VPGADQDARVAPRTPVEDQPDHRSSQSRPPGADRRGLAEAWRRHPVARWLLIVLVIAVSATSFLPWEWSFIDDGAMITNLRDAQARHGWLGGILDTIGSMISFDRSWGLFRPFFWVFSATFYLLPVGPAHAVRVAMLVCALAGPLVLVGRRFTGTTRWVMLAWTAAVLATGGQLLAGIWYPSLQELSGMCFVGLGLMARRRPALRALSWLAAAWFKAPFAWLLLAYGLVQARDPKTRRLGIASALVSAGTLGAATVMARTGTYTTESLRFNTNTITLHIPQALEVLAPPLLVLIIGLAVLRPRLEWWGADPTPLVLLVGGAGYLANLMPWKVNGYYAGPYVYLLSVAVVLAVVEVGAKALPRLVSLAMAVLLVGGYSLHDTAVNGYHRLANVNGLRDCVLRMPDGSVFGTNRHEAWLRLDFIVHEHAPNSTSEVTLVRGRQTVGKDAQGNMRRLDYYIYQSGWGTPEPSLTTGPVVCRTHDSRVYRVQ
jgi:hypothetical protein